MILAIAYVVKDYKNSFNNNTNYIVCNNNYIRFKEQRLN